MEKKKNSELKNLIEDTKNKEKIKKEKVDTKWIIKIIVISFFISFREAEPPKFLKAKIIAFCTSLLLYSISFS